MPKKLFISGMRRSGTTLVARMHHAHKNVVCASDPFRPYYMFLRQSIGGELDLTNRDLDVLEFPQEKQLKYFDAIQEVEMDRPFPDEWHDRLRKAIVDEAGNPDESQLLAEGIDNIHGDSFLEVFLDLWSRVPETYGSGTEKWEATKEVGTMEVTPTLARTFPESKFLFVVRDPRAVSASNNASEQGNTPWLFLQRQWRKVAAMAYCYEQWFPERVHVIRYEDLVQNPRDTVEGICEFLDVVLDERMLDPSTFVDGAGEQWLQNTSHGDPSESFDDSSVDKWRDVLTSRQIEYIEQLCYAEMQVYDYDLETDAFGLSRSLVLDPPRVDLASLDEELRKHYAERWDSFDIATSMANEVVRQQLLSCDAETFKAVADRLVEGHFYFREFAETARSYIDEPAETRPSPL